MHEFTRTADIDSTKEETDIDRLKELFLNNYVKN